MNLESAAFKEAVEVNLKTESLLFREPPVCCEVKSLPLLQVLWW